MAFLYQIKNNMRSKILRLNHFHEPTGWCTWQDVIRYQSKGQIVTIYGEDEYRLFGGTNKHGIRSEVEVNSIVIIKGGIDRKYRIPALTNERLFMRDLKRCAYCGLTYSNALLTKDHIYPESLGGPTDWTNCITACKSCNNWKANHLLDDLDVKLLYKPYVPERVETLIMKNPNCLPDQLALLTSYLPEHSRIIQYFELFGKLPDDK